MSLKPRSKSKALNSTENKVVVKAEVCKPWLKPQQWGLFSLIFLIFLLFRLLKVILLPFVAGFLIAYILQGPVEWMVKKGLVRGFACIAALVAFFVIGTSFIFLLFPLLGGQFMGLIDQSSEIVKNLSNNIVESFAPIMQFLAVNQPSGDDLSAHLGDAVHFIGNVLPKILSSSASVIEVFSLLLVTPIVAYYLLKDWTNVLHSALSLVPKSYQKTVRKLAGEIDEILSGYLKGVSLVCSIQGLYFGVALSIIGIKSGFLIGVMSGMLSFIPFVGPTFALSTTSAFAYLQGSPGMIYIWILIVIMSGQFLESHFLTPKLVGGKVQLHPAWVIFALLSGGAMFGFLGIMLSVPGAAVIGVMVRFLSDRYKKSIYAQ